MMKKVIDELNRTLDQNTKEIMRNRDAASGPRFYTVKAKEHDIMNIHIDGIDAKGVPDKVMDTHIPKHTKTYAGHKIPK